MYWSFWWFRGRFREISDEARDQTSDSFQGKFWWPELLFIQTSRVVFCYMISFILLLVTLLYRKAWYTQWCQPLDISNLEIFFSDQNPRDRICQWDSALENLFFIWTPYPPPPEQFCKKNMDLSVRDLNSWILIQSDSHLYRIDKEKTLFFLFAMNNMYHARKWSQKL